MHCSTEETVRLRKSSNQSKSLSAETLPKPISSPINAPPKHFRALCKNFKHKLCQGLTTIPTFGIAATVVGVNLNHLCSFSVPLAKACRLQNNVSNNNRECDVQISSFKPDCLWFNCLRRRGTGNFFNLIRGDRNCEISR